MKKVTSNIGESYCTKRRVETSNRNRTIFCSEWCSSSLIKNVFSKITLYGLLILFKMRLQIFISKKGGNRERNKFFRSQLLKCNQETSPLNSRCSRYILTTYKNALNLKFIFYQITITLIYLRNDCWANLSPQ